MANIFKDLPPVLMIYCPNLDGSSNTLSVAYFKVQAVPSVMLFQQRSLENVLW